MNDRNTDRHGAEREKAGLALESQANLINLSEFQGLILDLDGTLADTMPSHYVAWCEALAEHGLVFDEDLFYSWGGKPDLSIVHELSEAQGIAVDVREVAIAKQVKYLAMGPSHVKPVPQTLRLAERCRGVKPMAIATGGRRKIAQPILEALNMMDWFDAIVTADDVQNHKPDPETFAKAAEAIGVPASQCLAVEDAEMGLRAARAAGCQVIHVDDLAG